MLRSIFVPPSVRELTEAPPIPAITETSVARYKEILEASASSHGAYLDAIHASNVVFAEKRLAIANELVGTVIKERFPTWTIVVDDYRVPRGGIGGWSTTIIMTPPGSAVGHRFPIYASDCADAEAAAKSIGQFIAAYGNVPKKAE